MQPPIMKLLDEFRHRDPHLIADIEAAVRNFKEEDIDRENIFENCRNLCAFIYHNDDSREAFLHAIEEWKPGHVTRLVHELNRLPPDAPFMTIRRLVCAVFHWVEADMGISAERPLPRIMVVPT